MKVDVPPKDLRLTWVIPWRPSPTPGCALGWPLGRVNYTSGVLVDVVNELPSFGRGEVDVIGGTVPTCNADCEPARAGAESWLALRQRAH